MRISDWSSYVFSSDLLALRRFVGLPLRHCLLAIVIVLVLTVVLPLAFGFSVSTYGVALLAMLGVGGFLHFGRRHPAGPGILVAAGVRSEEHTSELQSLMRISYAVFCLKKQKQLPKDHAKPQRTRQNS